MEENVISDRVVQYVMTMPDEGFAMLSVSGLARWLKVDRYKLSRQFKSQKSMTLEFFLLKERMSRAAFLLVSDGGMSVKEVSRKMGFCTCDYFIRVFREYYGIVPGRFQEFKNRR